VGLASGSHSVTTDRSDELTFPDHVRRGLISANDLQIAGRSFLPNVQTAEALNR
jgi:hypothetical protein